MENYREKFVEAEKKANRLVEQLEKLREETESYQEASAALNSSKEDLLNLIDHIDSLVQYEKNLVEALGKIGTQNIIDRIDHSEEKLHEELTSLKEEFEPKFESIDTEIGKQSYITRNKLKRLQVSLYVGLGLIVILGVLVVLFSS